MLAPLHCPRHPHDAHIMTPQPSLLPEHRLIPDLNLAHQVLATVLILNLNITSVPVREPAFIERRFCHPSAISLVPTCDSCEIDSRGTTQMKHICIGILASLLTVTSASAGGWATVHKYVKRSGGCAGQEVLASMYSSGKRTASGERFDVNGNTAAARTWPLGTSLTVTNPQNGRSLVVRINDTGPWGIAYRMGARLDLARGAAQRLGMRASQYVCVA